MTDTEPHIPVVQPAHQTVQSLEKPSPMAADHHELDDLIGSQFDAYRVDRFLGAGAMGRVYLARHANLQRRCAIKLLPPKLVDFDPAYVERFRREGRAAASLSHPNVITVHACGEHQGCHFLEMEFVAGQSLEQFLEDERQLAPERATRMAARIADGLASAHLAGILHRDLKPGNILLTLQNTPKISDFGLAKRLAGDSHYGPEGVAGTPPFMAPELFQGRPATTSSDVYSLGVIYFQMLTGQLPYSGNTLNEFVHHAFHSELPNLSELAPQTSRDVREALCRMLDKTPENRPRDAVEAALILSAILGHDDQDLDLILATSFQHSPSVEWHHRGTGYELTVSMTNGRRQTIFLRESQHEAVDRLIELETICGPVSPSYMETALRINGQMPHGAIAIRDMNGRPMLMVVDNLLRSTVDAEEIRRSVLELAHRADAIEHLLTGADQH